MKLLGVTLFVGLAFIGGCSTTPVSRQSAADVPPGRIYEASFVGSATKSTEATVLFLRDSGFSGAGCSHDMFVDNVKVFAIRHGEKITIHLPAGEHFFRLETGGGLCPNIAASQQTTIAAGDHQVFRILLPSDGSLRLTRME